MDKSKQLSGLVCGFSSMKLAQGTGILSCLILYRPSISLPSGATGSIAVRAA